MHHSLKIKTLIGAVLLLSVIPVFAVVVNQLSLKIKLDYWQYQLQLSAPIKYRSLILRSPNRVVLDLYDAKNRLKIKATDTAGAPVKAIRIGHPAKGILRYVFDMSYPVKIKTHLLKSRSGRATLNVIFYRQSEKSTAFNWPWKNKTEASNGIQNFNLPPVTRLMPVTRNPKVIVVVDPGHGGKDPGATGPRGTHEKTVVLAISKKLAHDINNQPGFEAHLTRRGDYYLTLRQRLAIARKYKADMFIAIHADAFRNSDANGASVFALSERGATSEAARWIAEKENKSELMGGVNLSDKSNMLKSVLISLSQNAAIRSSIQIGSDIINTLEHFTTLHHDKVEQAAFVVLKSPDIPSLLVETGFISNPYEERRLRSSAYQAKIALALKQGIVRYFKQHPPRGSWLAYVKSHPEKVNTRYTVAAGDNLSKIAHHFSTSVRKIKAINQLNSTILRIGQRLIVPQS